MMMMNMYLLCSMQQPESQSTAVAAAVPHLPETWPLFYVRVGEWKGQNEQRCDLLQVAAARIVDVDKVTLAPPAGRGIRALGCLEVEGTSKVPVLTV